MGSQYLEFISGDYRTPEIVNYNEQFVPSPKKVTLSDAMKNLKVLMQQTSSINIPDIEDNFLLRFLYARKMNVESSYQLLLNYYKYRNNNPLFFNLSPKEPSIQLAFKDGLPVLLKNRDRKGRSVILFLIYQWDHSRYSFENIYQALLLTMEYLLEDVRTQVNGFVFIIDWNNLKFRDCTDLSPRVLKLMVDGFQDCFPAKVKGIHFVGQPWYVDGILSVIKSFLKEKTKQKFVVHGTNLSTLHEYLPPDVVTPELGGEGTSFTPAEVIDMLCQYHERLNKRS